MPVLGPTDVFAYGLQNQRAKRFDDAILWYRVFEESYGTNELVSRFRDAASRRSADNTEIDATLDKLQPFYHVAVSCQIPELTRIYETIFGRKSSGCFVEVGAFDGRSVSNTDGLADRGWTGLYIEPVPEYFHRCRDHHKGNAGVTVLNCAVGTEHKEVSMYVSGALSTLDTRMKGLYDTIDWAKSDTLDAKSISVFTYRLDELLRLAGVAPGFDLLVVDVEGKEDEVFRSFDVSWWRPRMIIAELEDDHPDFSGDAEIVARAASVRGMLRDAGYREEFRDIINTVFVDGTGSGKAG